MDVSVEKKFNIRLDDNIHHWPTLKTVLMVEKTLKDADGPVSLEELKRNLKKKIIMATCSSVDKTGINEVLKRPEIKEALKQDRITKEISLVEELLAEISKNNLAVYGLKDTEKAADAGAIKSLLITGSLIQKSREENSYEKIDSIMKITEAAKGAINIISSEHEGGKKLNGLGGIAAILRYKLNY